MPNDKIMTLFFRLEEMGFKLFIFSNSYEKRLLPFKEKLNVEIYFSSMKPFKKNYKKVLNKYKKEECAFIGDQIMTICLLYLLINLMNMNLFVQNFVDFLKDLY